MGKFKVIPSNYIQESYVELVQEIKGKNVTISRSDFNCLSIDEIINLLETILKDLYEQKQENTDNTRKEIKE